MPGPFELAALGAVLCLHRPHSSGALAGWGQAVHATLRNALHSDSVREELVFTDRDGRRCWRLWLLPDSDFLAWDLLGATLPTRDPRAGSLAVSPAGLGERLWSRVTRGPHSERWQACVLRLHAPRCSPGFDMIEQPVLAASLATLSPLGTSVALRIARDEGAEAAGVRDECCCHGASRVTVTRAVANDR